MAPFNMARATPSTPPAQKLALVAIYLGYFMVILDTTVVNVALPNIQARLGATVAGLQWVVDGYALVFASLLLTAGALGDRLGSKGVFLAGLVVFTVASAVCGAAPALGALEALEAARVVQGVGASLLVPASLALLRHAFADPVERARAFGLWGGIAGIAAGAGPVVGGFLVDALGWRSVFFVNAPVGVLAALLALRFVVPPPRLPRRGLDLPGQVAGIVTLGLLAFAFIEGGVRGWGALPILGALGASVLAAAAFLTIERRTRSPMLPLELFDRATFSAGNAVGLLINFGFYGQLFLISLFFQQVRGYSPLLTGLALLPETGVAAISSTLSGRVAGRVGPRLPMAVGLAVGGLGLLSMALLEATTGYVIAAGMLVAVGFGMSFTMPAMTAAVMEAAPGERAGIASSILSASRQIGGVLGVALLGALVGVGTDAAFVAGLHQATVVAGGAFLLGCGLTLRSVRPESPAADPGGSVAA